MKTLWFAFLFVASLAPVTHGGPGMSRFIPPQQEKPRPNVFLQYLDRHRDKVFVVADVEIVRYNSGNYLMLSVLDPEVEVLIATSRAATEKELQCFVHTIQFIGRRAPVIVEVSEVESYEPDIYDAIFMINNIEYIDGPVGVFGITNLAPSTHQLPYSRVL
ncbi:MAG TPA: hypothetical protein VEL47_02480 [Myxococcota bacterium]|nr:hypothetical protein [Myxococcota bacterium]